MYRSFERSFPTADKTITLAIGCLKSILRMRISLHVSRQLYHSFTKKFIDTLQSSQSFLIVFLSLALQLNAPAAEQHGPESSFHHLIVTTIVGIFYMPSYDFAPRICNFWISNTDYSSSLPWLNFGSYPGVADSSAQLADYPIPPELAFAPRLVD